MIKQRELLWMNAMVYVLLADMLVEAATDSGSSILKVVFVVGAVAAISGFVVATFRFWIYRNRV